MADNFVMAYVRVSSKDQNEGRQVDKMAELVSDSRFLFIDKASGKDFERAEYQRMKSMLRKGDLVYIDSLDRLGRDYAGIIREWKEITQIIGADIVALDMQDLFDSRKFKQMGDVGVLLEDQMLSLLSYVADTERKKIKQRQREGIDRAAKEGKQMGRPRVEVNMQDWEQWYPVWKSGDITAKVFMKKVNMKTTKFYAFLKEYEARKAGANV